MAAGVVRVPRRLPLLMLSDSVLLPGASLKIPVKSVKGMNMVRHHLLNHSSLASAVIGVVTREPGDESNSTESLHKIGTAAAVIQIHGTNWPQPTYTLLLAGLCRIRIDDVLQESPYPVAKVTQLDQLGNDSETDDPQMGQSDSKELEEAVTEFSKHLMKLIETMASSGLQIPGDLKEMLDALPKNRLVDVCVSILKSSLSEKLEVLDAVNLTKRFQKALPLVLRQLEALKGLQQGMNNQTNQWPTLIKRKPLQRTATSTADSTNAEDAYENDDAATFLKKIKAARMPKDIEEVALKELKRLSAMPPMMPECSMLRSYLELLVELPWSKSTSDKLDLETARQQLDADHYGLDTTKKRLLEYLAVRRLKNSLKGPILCLIGPPGVGKTSIGKSVALTLGRQFHRISLGGISDQADIRGHRRTYIGSMPGRIIQCLKHVKVNNPVILLDEVDKMSRTIHGDPAAALLEVLDPEQNHTFTDLYLNVPFDISQVLFIATANSQSDIPAPLLDRMEVITVPGYTQEDKVQIALRHLLKKQYEAHGLNGDSHICIPEDTVKLIVRRYTYEAGVRSLERHIGAICRAVAVKVAGIVQQSGKPGDAIEQPMGSGRNDGGFGLPQLPFVIDEAAAQNILGPPSFSGTDIADRLLEPGIAVALAWSPYGGDILIVEATYVRGSGKLSLTGQLGEVMKESAQLAHNWLRSHAEKFHIDQELLNAADIHIHLPEGAVGKDGPSAGVPLVVTLVSLFTGRLVRPDTAMTGEITLRGQVLPVGGIKEKVLAAHRAGLVQVILPSKNEKDLAHVPNSVKSEMKFVFVRSVDEALQAAIESDPDERLASLKRLPSKL